MFWDAHWSWIFLNDLWNRCATLQSTSNCIRLLTHNLWSGIPENHSIPLRTWMYSSQTLGRLLPFGPIQTGAVNAETPMSAVLEGHWLWPKSWTRLKTGSSPKNSCFHLGSSTCFNLLQPVQTSRRPSVATHAGAHHAVTQILHQALNGHGLRSCEVWQTRPSLLTPGLCGMAQLVLPQKEPYQAWKIVEDRGRSWNLLYYTYTYNYKYSSHSPNWAFSSQWSESAMGMEPAQPYFVFSAQAYY